MSRQNGEKGASGAKKLVQLDETVVLDSFAEAFPLRYSKILITAGNQHWLDAAVRSVCGFACSVIGCNAEVGPGNIIPESETPDHRIGQEVLLFSMGTDQLGKALLDRVGQCVMTCPTTNVFDAMLDTVAGKRVPLGSKLRFFGDGFQKSKLLGDRRFWRIPVMDGEFIAEEEIGVANGVAGGNLIFGFREKGQALFALPALVEAISKGGEVILPFPGGVVRSGSKVGSRYKGLVASTAEKYCPALIGRPFVNSEIGPDIRCVYEIVLDGPNEAAVSSAMKAGIAAATEQKVPLVTSGNYGGKLGPYHFHLRDLVSD